MDTRKTMDKLNELLTDIESCYMMIAKENALTYNALMLLLMVDSYEHLTQKQVCDTLHLPKSSVHSILSDLIARGCLALSEGGNKKEKYIIPTEAGAAFLQKVTSETEQMENRTLSSLPECNIAVFMRTAERLAEQMKKEAASMYGGDVRED